MAAFEVDQKVIYRSVETYRIKEVRENASGGWEYKLKEKNGKEHVINLGGSQYKHWFDESELKAA
jgi:hypothetical protein